MPTTYSPEMIILRGLEELGCSAAIFSGIAGFSAPRLSQAFSGIRELNGNQAQYLLGVLHELQELAREHAPVPIKFANAQLFRSILDERRVRQHQAQQEVVAGRDA